MSIDKPVSARSQAITAAALLALGSALALAAEAGLDAAGSTLVVTFRQEGVAVAAPFRQFSGHIAWDAAHPEQTTAAIDVQTASIDLGTPAYNGELAKPAWFDSARYPQATFRSSAVRALSPGHIEARGTLSIKGRVQPLTVAITVGASGAQAVFDGSFAVSRKAFAIGDADWESVLEDPVVVKFHLQERP